MKACAFYGCNLPEEITKLCGKISVYLIKFDVMRICLYNGWIANTNRNWIYDMQLLRRKYFCIQLILWVDWISTWADCFWCAVIKCLPFLASFFHGPVECIFTRQLTTTNSSINFGWHLWYTIDSAFGSSIYFRHRVHVVTICLLKWCNSMWFLLVIFPSPFATTTTRRR